MSDDQQIDALRSDIEQTRDDMSETIDQIEEKLSPDRLQEEVLQMARQLSDQLLSEFQSKSDAITSSINEQMQSAIHGAATAKADELFSQASDTLRLVGNNVWTRLSENPAPIALAAAGIGMLVMGEHHSQQNGQSLFDRGQEMLTDAVTNLESGLFNATESAEGLADQAGSTLGDAVEGVKARAGQMSEQVSSHLPQMSNGYDGGMDMGGLVGGMLALGLGFMAGLSIPESERERAAMEPVRSMLHEQMDKLGVDDMRGDAAGLMESVKQAGSEVVSSAKETLSSARQ
jgi:hypothetical protein